MKRVLVIAGLAMMLLIPASFASQNVKLTEIPSGVSLLDQDRDGLSLEVNVGEIEFLPVHTEAGDFVLPIVKGFSRPENIGEPSLPQIGKLISMPIDSDIRVSVRDAVVQEIDLKAQGIMLPIMPTQPSISKSVDAASVPFEFNENLYSVDNFYQLETATAVVKGIMRSQQLGLVNVSPFEYNPVSGKLRVYTSLVVDVYFIGGDEFRTEQLQERYYSPFYEGIYEKVINYESPVKDGMRDDLTKYPVKYLIISHRMFEAQLAPFIEWKTKKGFNVQVAYTDVIGTTSTAIKNYIQSVYNAAEPPEDPAPSFVLFVGDVAQIPPFDGESDYHVTDLYFCEFTGDDLPEIYYGRFSAQNTTQLQPQIDKTLEYEQYLMPDPSYLAEVTLVSGVDGTYAATHGNGQINYGTTYYFNAAHGITPNVWLYPASDASGAASAIIQTVSDGVSLYNYTAHCGHTGHSDPSFMVSDLSGLQNYSKYLLGIGNCCQSNTFDESTPCFGEAFLQIQGKGGIGYIGGSNSTYWYEDYYWGVGYGPVVGTGPTYEQTGPGAYDGIFHDHGEPVSQHYITNSAIIYAGNLAVTESGSSLDTYYWEIYHLMGDPSVMTFIGVPTANTVNHPSSILMTAQDVTIQAVPGSYIGLSMEGVNYGSGYVGSTGSITIPLEMFPAPGTADLVITAQFKEPYITTVQIIPPDGPFVFYESNEINDVAGNGDGIVDASEEIALGVEVKNVGPDDAYNVIATLTTVDTYVSFTDNTENYGTVPGNDGLVYLPDAFAFTVHISTPNGHIIPFTLEVTDGETTWISTFTMTVRNQPDINVLTSSVTEDVDFAGTMACPMTIYNYGPSPLDFSVSRQMFSGKSTLEALVPLRPSPIGFTPGDADKGSDPEPLYVGTDKGSGGPDQFGYFWVDSDHPDGPAVEWIDISTVGTAVTLEDDDSTGAISIGFSFPFYANYYDELHISSNGHVTFGQGSKKYSNTDIPNSAAPNNLIAPFWDDLDPEQYGDIYYYYDAANSRFIVAFVNVAFHYSTTGTGSINCEVILTPDGAIVLQYGVMSAGSDVLTSSTIGIENAAGTDGLEVVYNGAYIHDNMAIRFKAADWLSVTPGNGTVPPFGSVEISLGFAPGDLECGSYGGQVTIQSNDPDTPEWVVPVTMNVVAVPTCMCGDVDNNELYNILDITYLITYKFKSGPAPEHPECADIDGEPGINVLDIVYLVNNKYKSGPDPICD